jgi:acetate kinase
VGAAILALNAGSSSIKFALFRIGQGAPDVVFRGQAEGIEGRVRLTAADAQGAPLLDRTWPQDHGLDHAAMMIAILDFVETHLGRDRILAFSHRLAHGGPRFGEPVEITPDVLQALDALCPLAPLHQPHGLAAVRASMSLHPAARQIACFDTAFHRSLPMKAARFALPPPWQAQGVRRYGFHGLSYECVSGRLAELDPSCAGGRTIIAHLGSGASLCATIGGVSMDTTMGFSALDGLVMGTRCGALDPGVVLYLLREAGMTLEAVEQLLYRQSGLLGLSGLSSDMRVLLDSDLPAAAEAVDIFVFRLLRELGGLSASIRGLDTLVFTAGIGEHVPAIRQRVCEGLAWLGVEIDARANLANAPRISRDDSKIGVWVIPTDEERMLALHANDLMARGAVRRTAPRSPRPAAAPRRASR